MKGVPYASYLHLKLFLNWEKTVKGKLEKAVAHPVAVFLENWSRHPYYPTTTLFLLRGHISCSVDCRRRPLLPMPCHHHRLTFHFPLSGFKWTWCTEQRYVSKLFSFRITCIWTGLVAVSTVAFLNGIWNRIEHATVQPVYVPSCFGIFFPYSICTPLWI